MFPNLDKVEVKESVNYLPAGVHEVTVDEMKNSTQRTDYTGTPYVEFKVSNSNGISYLRFNGVDNNTSEKAAEIRTKIFKEFLQSAGAKTFGNLPTACKEVVGGKINVCLAEREYWTNDKETGEPVVKTITEYKFANPSGKSITWKDSFNKKLSPSDSAAYKAAYDAHVNSSGGTNTDAMPF